ncbi:MAG: tetratricopeptide repeat protein, partial [Oscillospiraceae bacterium]|nr:tetratricopeptide repeat protein [Oscillospiraceae bacterium]
MNIVRIFLASSVVEFRHEREELRTFMNTLNNIYCRRGIYFELETCEDMSNAMARERKQAEYNAFIRDAQYFYVLFGCSAGQYTLEEFDVALAEFREHGAPKIYTYFFQLPEGQTPEAGVLAFMKRLDRELGHYASSFTHIDSVKLNLILELSRDPLVGGKLKLEEGQALLDGEPVLSLEHIPLYSKNEAVQRLLAEKRRLDEEFAALASLGDSEAAKRMRLEKDAQRERAAEQLSALERDMLELYASISEKQRMGQRLNWREARAVELVEAGDYEGAKALLRDKLWTRELQQAETLIGEGRERVREYISGKRTLIRTIRSTGVTAESEREVFSVYREIAPLAEQYRLELDTLYDQARFLWEQKRFPEGIRAAERLRRLYAAEEGVSDADSAALYGLLGILYSDNRSFSEAETLHREALETYRRLAEGNPAAYAPGVAGSCINLAILFYDTNRLGEAEALHREALEIRRRLAEGNPAAYAPDVATSCNNLANLLYDTNRHEEAEALHREALET